MNQFYQIDETQENVEQAQRNYDTITENQSWYHEDSYLEDQFNIGNVIEIGDNERVETDPDEETQHFIPIIQFIIESQNNYYEIGCINWNIILCLYYYCLAMSISF